MALDGVVQRQPQQGQQLTREEGAGVFPRLQWMSWWDDLPSRYKVVTATFCSFIICNMDKVNLSVAIIPMAHDFGWSPSVAGLVQSSFFWGYMLCQLPGGYYTSALGGRRVLPAGVALWSAATAVVPIAAATIPGLCIARAAVGFGEATAPSAATDIIARSVPSSERARAVTFTFSGLHVGSIVGLLAAPWLISHCGWRSVFLAFGVLGFVWWWWFEQVVMPRIAEEEPDYAARLVSNSRATSSAAAGTASGRRTVGGKGRAAGGAAAAVDEVPPLPWRAFVRATPVKALMYTHFAHNWFHYTMLAWLPTYFVDTLSVDLMHASQTALLPPLAGIAASALAGSAADALVQRGVRLPLVRKGAQNVAFLLPTACLLAASFVPAVADSSAATVAAITISLGVSSFSLAGLFCTHQDMSPKYAPILLGLTNTSAAIPGVLGIASVGFLYERTQSWDAALFLPSAFFMVTAAAVYTVFARNDAIDFDAADNTPFAIEAPLARATAAVKRAVAGARAAFGRISGRGKEEEEDGGAASSSRGARGGDRKQR